MDMKWIRNGCGRSSFQIWSPNQLLWSTMRLTTMYSSTGTQPAMPEKVKCCSGWISMMIYKELVQLSVTANEVK